MAFFYAIAWGEYFKNQKLSYRQSSNQGIEGLTGLAVNYYFSPQLRLNADAGLSYLWQEESETMLINSIYSDNFQNFIRFSNSVTHYNSHFNANFSISLTYSIF